MRCFIPITLCVTDVQDESRERFSIHPVTETTSEVLSCSLNSKNVFIYLLSVDPLTTSWLGESFLRSQDPRFSGRGWEWESYAYRFPIIRALSLLLLGTASWTGWKKFRMLPHSVIVLVTWTRTVTLNLNATFTALKFTGVTNNFCWVLFERWPTFQRRLLCFHHQRDECCLVEI